MNSISFHITEVEIGNYFYLTTDGEAFFRGCTRCGGTGHYSFNGYDSICYKCGNHIDGRLGAHIGDRAAAEKDAAARQKRVDARIRKLDQKVANLRERDNDVAEFLLSINLQEPDKKTSAFIAAMAQAVQYPAQAEKPFTDKMLEAVQKVLAKNAERAAVDAARPAVLEGRVVIQGTVLSTKSYETDFGTAYKMLVEDSRGFKVYGSIPSSLWNDVEFLGGYRKLAWGETDGVMSKLVGMELIFTATVEASRDDKSFGFFKRPAKASIVD